MVFGCSGWGLWGAWFASVQGGVEVRSLWIGHEGTIAGVQSTIALACSLRHCIYRLSTLYRKPIKFLHPISLPSVMIAIWSI